MDKWQFGRSARFVTPKGRFSYPSVIEPTSFQGSDPRYSCTLLLSKDDKDIADVIEKLEGLHEEAMEECFGDKVPRQFERWGITDGDELEDPNVAGHWVVKASNKNKPAVVDADKQEVLDASEVYGGCYGRLNIWAKAYGSGNRGGVTFELLAAQKLEDGDAFGGAAKAAQMAVEDF